ncbi:DUF1129 family protein [Aerococcaceae bacterium DSM 111020]|nr:DUF1129 family protein [Aerococcaceae bacterium DSM 111020]
MTDQHKQLEPESTEKLDRETKQSPDKEIVIHTKSLSDEESISTQEQVEQMETIEERLEEVQESQDYIEEKSPIAGVLQTDFNRLTAKNQQFMVTLDRRLVDELDYEVRQLVYEEIVQTLLDGQDSGQTARHIYGTPTEVAQSIIDQELNPQTEEHTISPDWQIYVDGALLLGSIFTFLTGFSMANSDVEGGQYFGIVTMILNYLAAGLAMLITAKSMPDPNAPKGQKGYPKYFLASIGSMLVWFLIVSTSGALIPRGLNPILPPTAYMIIAVITFIGRILFKRHYDVKGGIF